MDREQQAKDVSLEPSQLDVECVRQADTFFKYAEAEIAAKAEADRESQALDTLEAQLQLRARKEPEAFGLTTTTEGAIKAGVYAHPKYIAQTARVYAAKRAAGLADAATKAMEMKRKMLELLVLLHGQEYFAGPSVPRSLVDAWRAYQGGIGDSLLNKQTARERKRVTKGK